MCLIYKNIIPKFLTSGQAQQKLDYALLSLMTSYLWSGMWMWMNRQLDFLGNRRGQGWGREGTAAKTEDHMAGPFSDWFSPVVCSLAHIHGRRSHLQESVTSGEMSQVLQHLSLVPPSYAPLQVSWAYMAAFMCSMRLQPRNITSIFDQLGLVSHSWSLLPSGSYPEILQSGRLRATQCKPTLFSVHHID